MVKKKKKAEGKMAGEKLLQLIEEHEKYGFTKHIISRVSGVVHQYISDISQFKRPGRDKIISICLSLNQSLNEINKILIEYDYPFLNSGDVSGVLRNNKRCKAYGVTLPLYSGISLSLLLLNMEEISGTKILVSDRPSAVFMKAGAIYYEEENDYPFDEADTLQHQELINFYKIFKMTLAEERLKIYLNNIKKHHFKTYICTDCFKTYIKNYQNDSNMIDHIANTIFFIKKYSKKHFIYIMNRCPHFHYQIQNFEGEKPAAFYVGKHCHRYYSSTDMNNRILHRDDRDKLIGYFSDSPLVVGTLRRDLEECQKAIIPELTENYPNNLIDHFFSLMKKYNLDKALEKKLNEVFEEKKK